jgi:hypothetical protein
MVDATVLTPCYGCGALVADSDGPTHRYIGASSGCWALHGEVLARAAADARFGDPYLFILNSYSVQHPGVANPQAIQSVVTHLIGLYAALALGYEPGRMIAVLRRAADGSRIFRRLEPPTDHYPVTIRDVHAAADPAAHHAVARAMAETTWAAWGDYHGQIAGWAAAVGVRR